MIGATVDEIAAKTKLTVGNAPNINWATAGIPESGNEPKLTGTVAAMKAKSISKPIIGNDAVIVVSVDMKTDAPVQKDYKAQQASMAQTIAGRVDYEVYDALKKAANVEEHLVKFY